MLELFRFKDVARSDIQHFLIVYFVKFDKCRIGLDASTIDAWSVR
jgi:hypothetical protein